MATPATPRIDWRRLLLPFLFIMVLPSVLAILVDLWLGSLPFISIVAIVVCFPTATILVIRRSLKEMDRVIAEVTPPELLEPVPDATLSDATQPEIEAEAL